MGMEVEVLEGLGCIEVEEGFVELEVVEGPGSQDGLALGEEVEDLVLACIEAVVVGYLGKGEVGWMGIEEEGVLGSWMGEVVQSASAQASDLVDCKLAGMEADPNS